MTDRLLLFVVDHDAQVRERVQAIAAQLDVGFEGFPSRNDFLEFLTRSDLKPACLVLELEPADHEEAAIPDALRECLESTPVIFTSGQTDVATAVRVMERGAVTVLQKPFGDAELSAYVQRAMRLGDYLNEKCERLDRLQEIFCRLSDRQQKILESIEVGHPNKKIASLLKISQRTVEAERARILAAFETESSTVMVARSTERRLLSEAWYRLDDSRPYVLRRFAPSERGQQYPSG